MTIKEAVIKYIEYRHSLGEKFKSAGILLVSFSKFIGDTTDISSINMESVNLFLYKGNKVTAMWFARHTSLKGFFQWAFQRSLIETIPLTLDMPKRPAGLVPYIYSRDELKRLFSSALNYTRRTQNVIIPFVYQTMLITMYTMGLRTCEVIALRVGDIIWEESYIIVRTTKFYKSRIIPFNTQVKKRLLSYFDWLKESGFSVDKDAPFFVTKQAQAVNLHTFRNSFKLIRKKAGIIRTDSDRYQPRIHDLRHTFATHRLIQWYKEGVDVQQMLPILSTYLGHTSIKYTSVYLTMTPELLETALQLFENYRLSK